MELTYLFLTLIVRTGDLYLITSRTVRHMKTPLVLQFAAGYATSDLEVIQNLPRQP